jgi:hypothetical protein
MEGGLLFEGTFWNCGSWGWSLAQRRGALRHATSTIRWPLRCEIKFYDFAAMVVGCAQAQERALRVVVGTAYCMGSVLFPRPESINYCRRNNGSWHPGVPFARLEKTPPCVSRPDRIALLIRQCTLHITSFTSLRDRGFLHIARASQIPVVLGFARALPPLTPIKTFVRRCAPTSFFFFQAVGL